MQNLLKYAKFLKKPIQDNNQIYFKYAQNNSIKGETYRSFKRVNKYFNKNHLIKEGGKRTKGYFRKDIKNKPLISIITVVLNHKKDLENTLKSIILQKYDNLEIIIIDGGSNGSVISKIRKYENYIDYWISQKDFGIWDAWNKGIKLASGSFICFLNVGDYFTENSIKLIVKKINKKKNLDIVFGTVLKKKTFSGFYPDKINRRLNIFPSFVSTFVNKNIYKKFGLFNLEYRYFNDYEFIYRVLKNKKLIWDTTSKNEIITVFDLKGFSSSMTLSNKLQEEFKIRQKYENIFMLFLKILLKMFSYFFTKIFLRDKYLKYN